MSAPAIVKALWVRTCRSLRREYFWKKEVESEGFTLLGRGPISALMLSLMIIRISCPAV